MSRHPTPIPAVFCDCLRRELFPESTAEPDFFDDVVIGELEATLRDLDAFSDACEELSAIVIEMPEVPDPIGGAELVIVDDLGELADAVLR